ncbi:MAG: primosomal protein N' [Elusimicrobia bacterium]|nr:primosomal protein N' [Elusimicrobiota bacterium]
MRIAEVACPVPLTRTFDYEVPEALAGRALPGARVQVPFGPRRLLGMVLGVRDGEPSRPLKALAAVLDPEPLLSAEMVSLARWLAARYGAPPGEVCKSLLPAVVKASSKARPESPPEAKPGKPKPAPFELTPGQAEAVARLTTRLREGGFEAALLFGVPASGKTEVYIRLIREAAARGGQALFLVPEISLTRPFFDDFEARAGLPVALWHSQVGAKRRRETWLGVRSGAVKVVVGARSASLLPFKDLRLAVLDEEQDESYKQDGKAPHYHAREVVLERARRCGALAIMGSATPSLEALSLVDGGQAVLVRMPERVARSTPPPRVLVVAPPSSPSRCLSDALVARVRDRLSRREQVILLVNRRGHSGFLLCRKCGWVSRCPSCGLAFVMHELARPPQGGASPGGTRAGATGQLSMFQRPGPEGPSSGGEPPSLFSSSGPSFHLLCHHCGRQATVPTGCQGCKAGALTAGGAGTQRVVAELRQLLPGAKVLRMDSDTVSKERGEALQDHRIYDQFKAGKADVLVGTKLVAKGFHFPEVTLVGVVDADSMLHMPDFRAAERTLQLLVQVAGRAGRAEKPGEVLVQSANPAHYAVSAVVAGDYLAFAKQEMGFRRDLSYPPSSALIRVLLSGPKSEAVEAAAEALAERLRPLLGGAEVVGPSPGVYQKLRGNYRFHLLVKLKDGQPAGPCLKELLEADVASGVKKSVQVDPYDLF